MSANIPDSSGPPIIPRLIALWSTLIVVPTPYSLPSIAAMALRAGIIIALPNENKSLAPSIWKNVFESGKNAIPMALITPPMVIR